MIYRLIAPKWLNKPVLEGEFSQNDINNYNALGYNIYYFPNYPRDYQAGTHVVGSDISVFDYCFVDFDLKSETYASKDEFMEALGASGITPTKVVDSGGGVHAYWRITNLDAMSYLRFQRRLVRLYNTDEAVGQLLQLMRVPGTMNTKIQGNPRPCVIEFESDATYTAEEFDKLLPPITIEDEAYCKQHYDRTNNLNQTAIDLTEEVPAKFGKLLRDSREAKELWASDSDDRSKSDYRLGHLMFTNGFTKDEARAVLMNTAKATQRAPIHRVNYASNIVDKIWGFELAPMTEKQQLSMSVREILQRSGDTLKGTRFPCHPRIDNTVHGFRLGQVIGLVAGSGVGKTAVALNMFKWFVELNPDYHHMFVPLEQPANEIADRWKTMCGTNTTLHDKVHIMSNYAEDGTFRHLSFSEIKDYILRFQEETGNKIGCVVIDHIGALKKKGSNDENQDLITICHDMKAFAVQTNTLLVMQSQTSREKAGIGDLELDKGAAYGTSSFEWYCDYLITMWQPLKRCHSEQACPTVTALKFCKIRHKKQKLDVIQEDIPYYFAFDSETEQIKDMTQDQITAFNFFITKATNKRKVDRKSEILTYTSVPYKEISGKETMIMEMGTNETRTNSNTN